MTYHRLTTLAILTALCLSATAMAEEERPRRMMDLLKPGMKVGVVFSSKSDQITLNVFSEEEHAIARDSKQLTLDELRKEYESVERRYQESRAVFREISGEEIPEGRFNYSHGPVLFFTERIHGTLSTVEMIGEDFVLLHLDGEIKGPVAFANQAISRVILEARGVNFIVRGRR